MSETEHKGKKHKSKLKRKNIIYFSLGLAFVFFVFLIIILAAANEEGKKKVVIYKLYGPITNSPDNYVIYKDDVIKDLKSFENKYDGVILYINSPGGDAYATKKIAEQIKKLNEKVPVISCVDEVAASGAYWLAIEGRKIIADDFSVVGSIGLIASYLQFSELMKKLGIKYERIVFGKYKDMMSPFRNLTPEEKALIMKKLSYIYEYFVKEVAKRRHFNYSYAKKLATGEIYFGYEAVHNGLIDEIGDLEKCKEEMAKELNTSVDNITFVTVKGYREQEFNLFGLSIGYGLDEALSNVMEKLNLIK